ncbi:DUF6476 family protein [Candidatus Halocynthiibacter alkanivorans]|uniref:DUF6476 family protein n=1 Tax=Candidatus Halocynthiibacter alkanivorans TaxID=2267619 RepID=UPI000DF22763|nr:DUF6476 family protein [Candidatus Halocynthiibacter alkanivorans]
MNSAPEQHAEEAPVRFLRRLVTTLTITMIAGLVVLIALFVIRFPLTSRTSPALPSEITLPDGVSARAVTFGPDWYAVVTTDERILIFGLDGTLRQDIAVK